MSPVSILILIAGLAVFGWALPIIGIVVLVGITVLYINRKLNPLPDYAITKKLQHCIIAHRAGTANASTIAANIDGSSPGGSLSEYGIIPENTLAAFRAAKQLGIKSVEFDVRMTLDGIAVCFHDETVGNTLQVPPNDANKSVSEFTFKELQSFPLLESRCGDHFAKERIPRFDDVVALCRDLDLYMMIEIKQRGNQLRKCCEQVARGIAANQVHDRCYVASFNPLALYYVRAADSTICTGFLYAGSASAAITTECEKHGVSAPIVFKVPLIAKSIDWILRSLGSPFMLRLLGHSIAAVDSKYISARLAEEYKKSNITVLVWTVNDPAQQEYLFNTLNVSVITDAPTMSLAVTGSDFKSE